MGEERENAGVLICGKKVRYIDPMTDWGFKKLFGIRINRHINRKEVIIYDPDYSVVKEEISILCQTCKDYTAKNKLMRAPNYIRLYFKYQDDTEVIAINEELERIIGILDALRNK